MVTALKNRSLILASLLYLQSYFSFTQAQVVISDAPAWIDKISVDSETEIKEDTYGYYYLLVDRQENTSRSSYYGHYAFKVLSNNGIESMSDISVSYDPSYQNLQFHSAQIIRNGETINKLKKSEIKTFQRESGMDRHLYDGRLSAVINLSDVRVGDIVEYSYSINGYNPVNEGHFFDKIYFNYGLPTGQIYQKLMIPESRNLEFKYRNDAPKANEEVRNGNKIYTWDIKNIPALITDSNYPAWHDPYEHVMITDFESWEEVTNWALKNYTLTASEKARLKEKINGQFDVNDKQKAVEDIIRFVQDEVRYLGFESGLNSYKPHSPELIMDQRFGDCKDKSFLLSSALQLIGVESHPVLVNSSINKDIKEQLPSPSAFDHCIVKIKYDSKTFFIDPTINNQGGALGNYYFPDYHSGLVIEKGSAYLEKFPIPVKSKTEVIEEFFIEEIGGSATLKISTTYHGASADSQRGYFSSSGLESIKKNYETFYSNLYPDISSLSDITFEDQREENKFIVKEEYYIETFWNPYSEDEGIIYAEVYPLSLEDYVNVTQSSRRDAPYAIPNRLNYDHKTIINLPERWTVKEEKIDVGSKDYYYLNDISYDDKVITINHQYQTFNDHIASDLMPTYVKDHKNIMKNLSYNLTYQKSDGSTTTSNFDLYSYTLFIISIVASFFLLRRLYFYDPTETLSGPGRQIGGWLILPAIGLTLTPLRVLFELFNSEFFVSTTWSYVWGHSLGAFLFISIELIINSIFLVFSILVVILFYNKRSSAPLFVTIFYSVNLGMVVLDSVLAYQIFPELYTAADDYETFKDIFRSVVAALIWIPYFNLSSRVKETFVVKLDRNKEPEDDEYREYSLKYRN